MINRTSGGWQQLAEMREIVNESTTHPIVITIKYAIKPWIIRKLMYDGPDYHADHSIERTGSIEMSKDE